MPTKKSGVIFYIAIWLLFQNLYLFSGSALSLANSGYKNGQSSSDSSATSNFLKEQNISGYMTKDFFDLLNNFSSKSTADQIKLLSDETSSDATTIKTFVSDIVAKNNFDDLKNVGINPDNINQQALRSLSDALSTQQELKARDLAELKVVFNTMSAHIMIKASQLQTSQINENRFNDFAQKSANIYNEKKVQTEQEVSDIKRMQNAIAKNLENGIAVSDYGKKLSDEYSSLKSKTSTVELDLQKSQDKLSLFEQKINKLVSQKIDETTNDVNDNFLKMQANFAKIADNLDTIGQNNFVIQSTKTQIKTLQNLLQNSSSITDQKELSDLNIAVKNLMTFAQKTQIKDLPSLNKEDLAQLNQSIQAQQALGAKLDFYSNKINETKTLASKLVLVEENFKSDLSLTDNLSSAEIKQTEDEIGQKKAEVDVLKNEEQQFFTKLNQEESSKLTDLNKINTVLSELDEQSQRINKNRQEIISLTGATFDEEFLKIKADQTSDYVKEIKSLNNKLARSKNFNEQALLKTQLNQATENLANFKEQEQLRIINDIQKQQGFLQENDSQFNDKINGAFDDKMIEDFINKKSLAIANLEAARFELKLLENGQTLDQDSLLGKSSKEKLVSTLTAKYKNQLAQDFTSQTLTRQSTNPEDVTFAKNAKMVAIWKTNLDLKNWDNLSEDERSKIAESKSMLKNKLSRLQKVEEDPTKNENFSDLLRLKSNQDLDNYDLNRTASALKSQINDLQKKIDNLNNKKVILRSFLQGAIDEKDFPNGVAKIQQDLAAQELELRRILSGDNIDSIRIREKTKIANQGVIDEQEALKTLLKKSGTKLDDLIGSSDENKAVIKNVDQQLLNKQLPKPPKGLDEVNKQIWIKEEIARLERGNLFANLVECSKSRDDFVTPKKNVELALKLLRVEADPSLELANVVVPPAELEKRQQKLQALQSAGNVLQDYLNQTEKNPMSLTTNDGNGNVILKPGNEVLGQIFKPDELVKMRQIERSAHQQGTLKNIFRTSFGQKILDMKDADSPTGKNGGFGARFSLLITGDSSNNFSQSAKKFNTTFSQSIDAPKSDAEIQQTLLDAKKQQDDSNSFDQNLGKILDKNEPLSDDEKKIISAAIDENTDIDSDTKLNIKGSLEASDEELNDPGRKKSFKELMSNLKETLRPSSLIDQAGDAWKNRQAIIEKLKVKSTEFVNGLVNFRVKKKTDQIKQELSKENSLDDDAKANKQTLQDKFKMFQKQIKAIEELDSNSGNVHTNVLQAKVYIRNMKDEILKISDDEISSDDKRKLLDIIDQNDISKNIFEKDFVRSSTGFAAFWQNLKSFFDPNIKAKEERGFALLALQKASDEFNKTLKNIREKTDLDPASDAPAPPDKIEQKSPAQVKINAVNPEDLADALIPDKNENEGDSVPLPDSPEELLKKLDHSNLPEKDVDPVKVINKPLPDTDATSSQPYPSSKLPRSSQPQAATKPADVPSSKTPKSGPPVEIKRPSTAPARPIKKPSMVRPT